MVTLFITSGAIMKLAGTAEMQAQYARIGFQHQMAFFAVAELLFISLFLYRKTMKIGLLLLTGYFGGAMGVELSLGSLFIFPAIILTVIWIAAYLRDASVFKPFFQAKKYLIQ